MIYDIKPEPRNAWGLFKNWQNWMTAKLISESRFSKRIEVSYE